MGWLRGSTKLLLIMLMKLSGDDWDTLMLLYLHTGINNCSTAVILCYDNNKQIGQVGMIPVSTLPFNFSISVKPGFLWSSTFSQGNRMTIMVMTFPCE